MKCTQCGSPIDESAAFCPQCGAPAAAARTSASAATDEAAVRPLLAAARLHRSRRQYEQAIAKCMAALEQQPGSGSACSLLGDIERDRGNLREAAEWYKQAVAADSANVVDQRKLDEVLDRLYVSPERPSADSDSAATAGAGGRRLPWVPLLIGFATLLIVVIAAVGGSKWASSRRVSVTMPRGPASSATPGVPRGPAPTPAAPPSASPTIAATPATSGFLDERERRAAEVARTAIQGQQPAASVAGVFVRPDNGQVELILNLTAAPTPTEARTAVLRPALAAAQAVQRSDAGLKSFSVRVRAPLSDAAGAAHNEVVFMGELAAVAVADRDVDALSADDAEALFTRAWWRPDFAGGGSAGATEARP